MPLSLRDFFTFSSVKFLLAFDLDIVLPAPCAVEPKLRSIELDFPNKIQLEVPIEPGTNTGCPKSLYLEGISARFEGNARVAPFL